LHCCLGLASVGAVVQLDHRHRKAQHIRQQNKLLAHFIGDMADRRDELNALNPFLLGQLHFAGKGMEMFDETDHDLLQSGISTVLVARYDFVGEFRSNQGWHFSSSFETNPAADREEMNIEAVGDQTPKPAWREQHNDHRDGTEQDHVPGAIIGQEISHGEEYQSAKKRSLDPADAADDDNKDDVGGPI